MLTELFTKHGFSEKMLQVLNEKAAVSQTQDGKPFVQFDFNDIDPFSENQWMIFWDHMVLIDDKNSAWARPQVGFADDVQWVEVEKYVDGGEDKSLAVLISKTKMDAIDNYEQTTLCAADIEAWVYTTYVQYGG